jgi:transposase
VSTRLLGRRLIPLVYHRLWSVEREALVLFVGDDWSEDFHDVAVKNEAGRVLARARLTNDLLGTARLHAMIGEHVGDAEDVAVLVGIETDRGPWVQGLVAAGYQLLPVNPKTLARFREAYALSGAKSDPADAELLAEFVRQHHGQLRPIAGDSGLAEAIKIVARAHKTLIWERTRHLARLRQALLEFFPAALIAFDDLDAADALALLAAAPDPVSAAGLSREQISAALKRARRRKVPERAAQILAALRTPQLAQPPVVAGAYAATVRAQVAILTVLNAEIKTMEQQVEAHFGKHPDAEIYLSQPGLGSILGARVLAEFGDDNNRYADAKARKNYAATSPITRRSGKKLVVMARFVHNDHLVDALHAQAFSALRKSPGARAYYQRQRARGVNHNAALRQLGNRLVGIQHGCLKTRTPYDEATAWPPNQQDQNSAA